MFNEPVLVVRQRAKLVELHSEYGVYDEVGNQIAAVREVGLSRARKLLRVANPFAAWLTHTLHLLDMSGALLLAVIRDTGVKGRLVVEDSRGGEIGRVVQQNLWGRRRFDLVVGDRTVGFMDAEMLEGAVFRITDEHGDEVGRVLHLPPSLAGVFTPADNYAVQIHHPLEEPLLSLTVVSALCVDLAMHQRSPAPLVYGS